jgi:hypothetical protein
MGRALARSIAAASSAIQAPRRVPRNRLAQLRRIERQSVSINQAAPINGISSINREQADLFAAMSLKRPAQDTQLPLL